MSKSFWGIMVVMLGVASIFFITLFQTITNTDEHNSQLLKEVTEAAMWEAVDYSYFRKTGYYKINKEKFVENFLRRYADSASKSRHYKIEFIDINEIPPKVSIRISSGASGDATAALGSSNVVEFNLTNKIDAILETPY